LRRVAGSSTSGVSHVPLPSRGMAYTFQVTVDCRDPHRLAAWWAQALRWEVEPQDAAFIKRMIAEGFATEDDTTTYEGRVVWKEGAAITHPEGTGRAPRMLFQTVSEDKVVKNRVHLDLRIGEDELAATVERLTDAGATFLHEGRQGPHAWVTLADPEGNEFCVSP